MNNFVKFFLGIVTNWTAHSERKWEPRKCLLTQQHEIIKTADFLRHTRCARIYEGKKRIKIRPPCFLNNVGWNKLIIINFSRAFDLSARCVRTVFAWKCEPQVLFWNINNSLSKPAYSFCFVAAVPVLRIDIQYVWCLLTTIVNKSTINF